jgi:hypothetical protein
MQSQSAVRMLDQTMGRVPDASSARMAASLTVLAKQEGLQRIDNIVLSRGTDAVKPGENVIAVQGRLDDPSHQRAHMKTQTAIETPVTESFKQLEVANAQQKMQPQNVHMMRDNAIPTQQIQDQEVQRQILLR